MRSDLGILKHGAAARLFPVYAESSKEQRSLSILLATMMSVRPFAERILDSLGVKVRKRTRISAFTEVTLVNEVKGIKDRPDALLVVDSGRSTWTALIEAKVGKCVVEPDQLQRYAELAKLNGIDAIITITNELTPAPSIHPTQSDIRKLDLFHLSWSSILTSAFLLAAAKENPFDNDDEAFLVSELVRYLEHPGSGRLPLDQMNRDWPKTVADVQAGHPINARGDDVTDMVTTWYQEARDVALIMTRKLREPVTMAVSRSQLGDPLGWIEEEARTFQSDKCLRFELEVPHAASRLAVEADFLRRSIRVSMKVQAPTDKASNGARVNWLLRQLQKADLSKVILRCNTRGKGQNFGGTASEIDPKSDDIKDLGEIVSFKLEMSTDLGSRFNSRKKFVEGLEELVPAFYENVGQHLQAWVAAPPKVQRQKSDTIPMVGGSPLGVEAIGGEREHQSPIEQVIAKPPSERPSWASSWQNEPVPEEPPPQELAAALVDA